MTRYAGNECPPLGTKASCLRGGRDALLPNRSERREDNALAPKRRDALAPSGRDAFLTGRIRAAAATALLALVAATAAAVDTEMPLQTAEQQGLYRKLLEEVRCMVCQNQNLADSDAPLAKDMRRELRRMVEEGASEDDVKQFLLARYGDFALYRPRLAPNTLLLWAGPGIVVAVALGVLATVIRRRSRLPVPEEE